MRVIKNVFICILLLTGFYTHAEEKVNDEKKVIVEEKKEGKNNTDEYYYKMKQELLDAETRHMVIIDKLKKDIEITSLKLKIEENKAKMRKEQEIDKGNTGKFVGSNNGLNSVHSPRDRLQRKQLLTTNNISNSYDNVDLKLKSRISIDDQIYLNIEYGGVEHTIKINEKLDGWRFRIKNNKIIATKNNLKKVL